MIITQTTKSNNIPQDKTSDKPTFGQNLYKSMNSVTKNIRKQWSYFLEEIRHFVDQQERVKDREEKYTWINLDQLRRFIGHPSAGGENEEKCTGPNRKEKESNQKLRHWKITKKNTWESSFSMIRLILFITTIQYSINDLSNTNTNTNEKTYNLYHDKFQVNKMGNPFPVKTATMIRKRSKLKRMYIKQHRKNKKLREWKEKIKGLRFENLRKLTQTIIKLGSKMMELQKLYNLMPKWKGQGKKTYCIWCAFPYIGLTEYFKQNYKNITMAMITPATYMEKIKLFQRITTQMLKAIIKILMAPFQRMTKKKNAHHQKKRRHHRRGIRTSTNPGIIKTILRTTKNILKITMMSLLVPFLEMTSLTRKTEVHRSVQGGRERQRNQPKLGIGQLDGNDDLEYSSEEEDCITSIKEGDYGWSRTEQKPVEKPIGFWYNWNRPIEKTSKLKNAPKMIPPVSIRQEQSTQRTTTDDVCGDVSEEEEIEITLSETGRTKILTMNVRSAVSDIKQSQIRKGIGRVNPDVVIITESWFDKYDQDLRVENYVPIARVDRPIPGNKEPNPNKRGGGVLVLAKKDINITEVYTTSLHKEIQIARFVLDKITIYGIYRTGKKLTHELLTKWLDTEIIKLNEDPYIITGDLNLPLLAKANFKPKLKPAKHNKHNKTKEHMWAELVDKHGIQQLVEKPTQRKGNILDYIFVPINVNIESINIDRSAFDTNFDHYAVTFEMDSYYQRKKEESHRRKESPESWKKFREILKKTDFMSELKSIQESWVGQEAIDKMSSFIVNTLKTIYEAVTPLCLTKPPPIKGFLSKPTIRQLAHARRLYRSLVKCVDDEKKPHIKAKLKQINKANRWMIRRDRIAWEFRRLHLSKNRGDDFYRFMNDITRKTVTLGPIRTAEGLLLSKDKDMATAYNDYLCDLMLPSTTAAIDWDIPYEPKGKQLMVAGIPGCEGQTITMENDQVRNYVIAIHQELHAEGYSFTVEDIIESYPLGMKTRGRKSLPLVLTYKDEETMQAVKAAAMRSGLWNRRIQKDDETETEEGKKDTQKPWMKKLVSKLGVTMEYLITMDQNANQSSDKTPKTYFKAALETMKSVDMTTNEIRDAIKKAKRTSAPGPDGLRMSVFAESCSHITRPLQVLYNRINELGLIPRNFKIARVIMLHKKNSKQDMGNYRPISMANHISKTWERVLNARLMIHLKRNNMLTRHQHGFRPKRGCHTNLMEAWEKIIEKTAKYGPTVEVWSFDLQKAFDLLDHGKALTLCHKAGINGNVGKSLQNWLLSRDQYVQCGKETSEERKVNRSCVQGSVLGPTLWLIYVQSLLDMLEEKGCDHYAYADDVAIVAKISTPEEIESFKEILNTLLKWGDDYNMKWGAHKTQRLAMRYQNCGTRTPPDIHFDGKLITPTNTIESLGIILNMGCVPYAQHDRVKSNIKSIRVLIAKGFKVRTQEILERLYTTYILPKINYCSQIYHTGQYAHLKDIESEINRYWKLCDTKIIHSKILGIREQLILNDLKFMHKIRHGLSPIDFDEFFTISESERNSTEKIKLKKSLLTFPRYSFTHRIQNYWNYLPVKTRNSSPEIFKEKVLGIFTNKKLKRHRLNLLNFGLDTPISGPPDDTKLT